MALPRPRSGIASAYMISDAVPSSSMREEKKRDAASLMSPGSESTLHVARPDAGLAAA